MYITYARIVGCPDIHGQGSSEETNNSVFEYYSYSYSSFFEKRILFVLVFVHFQNRIIFIFVFVKILKNEYYSNNKILKWTSKNNIIPHIWGFLQILTNFHIIFTIFYNFLYFHLFFSKHFETYLSTIRIIFVFVFIFIVILKTNSIRIRIREIFNQLEKLEAAKAAWLVCLSLLTLTGCFFWVNFYWPYLALLSFTGPYLALLSLT